MPFWALYNNGAFYSTVFYTAYPLPGSMDHFTPTDMEEVYVKETFIR